MKLFLSWSGKRSYAVAEALRDWIPDVINAVEPFLSSDIEKGAVGVNEIAAGLRGCTFGIICVTPGNQNRPWINYEAGALSKAVGDDPARVATLLVDIARATEVTGPLAQFQATKLELTDMKKLMVTMNKHIEKPREAVKVESLTEQLWPRLKEKLDIAVAMTNPNSRHAPGRSVDDKLDELLAISRDMARSPRPLLLSDFPGFQVSEQDVMAGRFRETVLKIVDETLGKKSTRGLYIRWSESGKPVIRLTAVDDHSDLGLLTQLIEQATGFTPDFTID